MCRRVQCKKCGRPSFAGCGNHVEQVLGDVAPSDRCRCHEAPAMTGSSAAGGSRKGWLSRLTGR